MIRTARISIKKAATQIKPIGKLLPMILAVDSEERAADALRIAQYKMSRINFFAKHFSKAFFPLPSCAIMKLAQRKDDTPHGYMDDSYP
jgi:ubiquitin